METSLRFSGDSKPLWPAANNSKSRKLVEDNKALRLHAKQTIHIHPNTQLQVHGELDTKIGAPTFASAVIKYFDPDSHASLGVGLQIDKIRKLQYCVRGKKAFPFSTSSPWSLNIKGRCDVDKEFTKWNSKGRADVSWSMLNFQKTQDVRLKLGVELSDKLLQVPYMQIQENNWSFNADMNGKWSVSFKL